MGGKEERSSDVGRSRAHAERRGATPSEIPGPTSDELLRAPKRGKGRGRRAQSKVPRAGPSKLEPEDKAESDRVDSLDEKLKRQPKTQLPDRSDE